MLILNPLSGEVVTVNVNLLGVGHPVSKMISVAHKNIGTKSLVFINTSSRWKKDISHNPVYMGALG